MILRQSTSGTISFGPFLDKTDGVTLETGMVTAIDHATTGILLSKNGGALTIRSQAVTASTYDAYGNYIVTLSATDKNTVGTLRVQFSEAATCLPVWQDFQVIEEAVYDAYYAASGTGVPAAGALEATLTAMKGATYSETTDSLEALRNRGDAAWITATGFSTLSAAQVNTEIDTALVDIHLDHLLAVDYDPAAKPGVATALLNELIESDAGVSRYTANSLEQAPSGTGASAIAIADEVQTRTIARVTLVDTVTTVTNTTDANIIQVNGETVKAGITKIL